MFDSKNKLKGYLQKEVKENKIHSNYGYNYYFCRTFLKRLYENNEQFVLKGSFSKFANIGKIARPLTDIDIITFDNIDKAINTIDKTINQKSKIKFAIKQKFITPNNTTNYRILCHFDGLQNLIEMDLRKEKRVEIKTVSLPKLFSKDIPFKINTITLEEYLSNKLYACFLYLYAYKYNNKRFRRFKDFYDIYTVLEQGNINLDKTNNLLKQKINNDEFLKTYQFNNTLFDNKFININREQWNKDKNKYEFQKEIPFEETINITNEMIDKARKR